MATLDPSRLSDLERGRLEKHLSRLVRDHDGRVVTFRELYARPEYLEPCRVTEATRDGARAAYALRKAGDQFSTVPRLVYLAAGGDR